MKMARRKMGGMTPEQLLRYASMLIEDVKTIYDDVKLLKYKGLPYVKMPEGNYLGMSAIRVLENLKDDITWEDDDVLLEDDEE